MLIPDVVADPTLGSVRETVLHEGIRALAFIPLVYQERLLDKFMLYDDAPHVFSPEEVQIGQTIEGHVAMAIGRRVEEAERERLLAREQALVEIGRALVSVMELARAAEVVMEQSLLVLDVDAVTLWLADPARRELTLIANRNSASATVEALRHLSYNDPLVATRAARTGQIQVVKDVWVVETDFPRGSQVARREGVRTVLALPLGARRWLVGVVSYATRVPRLFSSRDLEFNATVADLFAVAIENARLYEQVRESLRLREEFMAAAIHELKTPVTAIKGWADLLLEEDSMPRRERKALETIGRQSDRITRLIKDLPAALRLHPGAEGLALERQRFDLTALVRQLVERTARTTERQQCRFTGPESPVPGREPLAPERRPGTRDSELFVDADRDLISQVVSHLLENVIRYSPDGGPIDVDVRRAQGGARGEAVVSVRDYGVGMPVERQPHVFEPFYEPVPAGAAGY